jgi:hypothetical protein
MATRKKRQQQLSQKPAAVKLRHMRRNRSEDEKLRERIRAQRQSAIRKAKVILERTAWAMLGAGEKGSLWQAVEGEIREK